VALYGRALLLDLVAPNAHDERDLQPLARPLGMGERNSVQRRAEQMQDTAGSGPPTDSWSTGDTLVALGHAE
jgi:hypothetical protein